MNVQGLVPMALALVGGIGTSLVIRRRLALGRYPPDKVGLQRGVMWGFMLIGVVFFVVALVRSLTY